MSASLSTPKNAGPFTVCFVCRGCGGQVVQDLEAGKPGFRCDACGLEVAGHATERVARERIIERCAVCGNRELYVRKDFKQRTGVFVVVIAMVAASILYAFNKNMLWPILLLVASTVLDAILYQFVPDLTACYKCKAEYRGTARHPANKGYSHYTAERYRAQARQETGQGEGGS